MFVGVLMNMAANNKARNALFERTRERLPPDSIIRELDRFGADFNAGPHDCGIALAAVAILEQALEDTIISHCPEAPADDKYFLFKESGSSGGGVSTFNSKISLAFALGVFGPKSRATLKTVQHIRNAFAHSRGYVDFDTPEVAALCNFEPIIGQMWEVSEPRPETSKSRFLDTISYFSLYLTDNEDRAGPKRYRGHFLEDCFS